MKKLGILVIALILTNCKSITKDEYLLNSCNCIDNIESSNKESLKLEIGDCLRDNFVNYSKMASKEIENILEENPNITKEEAQNKLIERLHNELLETCESYKNANLKLDNL
ncbi:hypothetical protein EGM88_07145 [Aureibaculum marinum]|uniref:Uncharacterized protein n=1 Tax=Aureibaculum marinum TaxID=2487930 RepID=A0A3N4NTD5_9FLAO|nr:hypothetical protein [Aureibaculum marinum]RPD97937.1 hypothetical protein EGM88_07145 [Aureibaculum marinum]